MGSKSSKRAETTVDSAESDASSEEANGLMTLSQEQVEGARGTLEEIMARMDVEKSLHGTASDRYKKMVKQKEILLEIIRLDKNPAPFKRSSP
ncbi:Protein CBG28032 [Caenorhabditis briggsae]|uniref:Protein CBG28032 n=1 Tax=Caenorhabditis briggsae TaxID=6238 RepID=B6IG28_CAEBR|nr:Protein CBG28032 [Caenorhabditis briggsae]CAR98858.1 Protein CBG28032 [Caenorhabditis briggsae]